jgi:hypothetical protein
VNGAVPFVGVTVVEPVVAVDVVTVVLRDAGEAATENTALFEVAWPAMPLPSGN